MGLSGFSHRSAGHGGFVRQAMWNKRAVSEQVLSESRPAILHVVNSLEGGGTERTLVTLLRGLESETYRHVVVTMRAAGSLSAQLPDHVGCVPIGARGRCWFAGLKLARIARETSARLIHARNTGCWPDAVVSRVLTSNTRLLLGFHGLECDDPFSKTHRWWMRLAQLFGARFTSVSAAGRRKLHEQAGVPLDRVAVVRNGVDLFRFQASGDEVRRRVRAEWQLDDTACVVGTVGSLTSVKGHIDLVEAVRRTSGRCSNIYAIVIGNGPLRSEIMREAQRAGVGCRFRFTGQREDVPALLSGMDAYVCSSRSEGMNNALLEAMAAGLAIVATDVGDNAMIARPGVEGWIVPPRSPGALAGALQNLIEDPTTRRRFAQAARSRAKKFSLETMTRSYRRLYDTIMAETHAGDIRAGQHNRPPLPA